MEKTKQKDRGEGRKCQEGPVADSGRWSVLVTFMYGDMKVVRLGAMRSTWRRTFQEDGQARVKALRQECSWAFEELQRLVWPE